MSSLLCRWFGIGCPTPPNPTPLPTPPALRAVAVIAVPGAQVTLDNVPTPFTGVCNQDGYVLFPEVPESLGSSHLDVIAKGFNPYSVHVDILPGNCDLVVGPRQASGAHQVQLPSLVSAHVDPSVFSLRDLARLRGAMWTVRGPWRFGPRPGSPDNITALEFLYSYGDDPAHLTDEQQAMLTTYKSYGYTHVAFGPPMGTSYHGQYPDTDFSTSPEMFEKWLDWLQVFWDQGLAPVVFFHRDGDDFEQTTAAFDHLIRGNARAQRLIRIVVPTGWEPTRYDWSSYTWEAFVRWGADLLPNALILIHTVPDVDAPCGNDALGSDVADETAGHPTHDIRVNAWRRICPHIHGWLVQASAFEDPNTYGDPNNPTKTNFDNWADSYDKTIRGSYYDRFHHGYAGWPTTSKWGNEPIKVYAAEYCSYWEYWQNRPYAEGVAWGDRALRVGADGVLDSCSPDAIVP